MNLELPETFAAPRSRAVPFEDRAWPVNLALLVLAGLSAWVIWQRGDFEDPRWWANGRSWLAAVGIATLVLMGLATRVRARRFRRGLLLAALISMIYHVALIAGLETTHVATLSDRWKELPPRRPIAVSLPVTSSGPEVPVVPMPSSLPPLEVAPPPSPDLATRPAQRSADARSDTSLPSLPPEAPAETDAATQEAESPDRAPRAEEAPTLADHAAALAKQAARVPDPVVPVEAPAELTIPSEIEAPRAPADIVAKPRSDVAMSLPASEAPAPDTRSAPDVAADTPQRTVESQLPDVSTQATNRLARSAALPAPTTIADSPDAEPLPAESGPNATSAGESTPIAKNENGSPRLSTDAAPVELATPARALPDAELPAIPRDQPEMAVPRATPRMNLAQRSIRPAQVDPAASQVQLPDAEEASPLPDNVNPPPIVAGRSRSVAAAPLARPAATEQDATQPPVSAPAMEAPAIANVARPQVDAPSPSDAPAPAPGKALPARARRSAEAGLADLAGPIAPPALPDDEPGANQPDTAPATSSVDGNAAVGRRSRPALEIPRATLVDEGPSVGADTAPSSVGALPRASSPPAARVADAARSPLANRRPLSTPTIDGRTREPAPAYVRRNQQRAQRGQQPGAPSEAALGAIELGLEYLVRQQSAEGHWSLTPAGSKETASFRSDTAATGLALLSLLGAGYDHFDGPYRDQVQRALNYLVEHQKANGDLYVPQDAVSNQNAWLYSHGIAAIALCEAYGMTGDTSLAGPAQKAIDFIVAAQDPRYGAWRYTPRVGSDTSVSGWQIMALKSGELAGLRVPAQSYEQIKRWLEGARSGNGQYVYNPYAANTPAQAHGRRPSPSMTAVALLMRLYTGWNRQDAGMAAGADQLARRLPSYGSAAQPARDTYYWYYATQVMFHMRGRHWQAWSDQLYPLLVEQQVRTGPQRGSWDPRLPIPDRWGSHGGRLYVTALNLLSLEVYYRHLPIYESTAK